MAIFQTTTPSGATNINSFGSTGGTTIVIPKGATLSGLARQYNTTIQELLRLNPNIKDPNKIVAGSSLAVPSASGQTSQPRFSGTVAPSQPAAKPKLYTTPSGAVVDEYGNLVSGPPTTTTPTSAATSTIADQLSGTYKEMYTAMKGFLDQLQARGQAVNPNIQITPEKAAEFMKQAETDLSAFLPQAEKEILPFYENQLKVAREGFLSSLGYSSEQLLKNEQDLERKFAKGVRGIGETAAEQGFALSGGRQRDEQELVEEANRQVASGRSEFGYKAGQVAKQFAQQYGTANLPGFSLAGAPKVGLEGFERPLAGGGAALGSRSGQLLQSQPLYELSPSVYAGLEGEKEFEKRAAVRSRAADLENAFRTSQAVEQKRSLIL